MGMPITINPRRPRIRNIKQTKTGAHLNIMPKTPIRKKAKSIARLFQLCTFILFLLFRENKPRKLVESPDS
jgi:hypothetical protein